jgi:mRNA-degrading endonuclease RelE of RelBE toxin-antitoxin system
VVLPQKNWHVKRVANSAEKSLHKIDLKIQRKILIKIECLEYDPFICDICKVQGRDNIYRMRVDDYRVFFRLCQSDKTIEILLTIGHKLRIKEKMIQRL